MQGASDAAIWDHALASPAVVVTKDEDFAQRKVLSRTGPVVVWIRLPNTRRRGELYVVTGPAFTGTQIDTIEDNRVLVPTAVWKASIDALAGQVGIDPFPGVSPAVKARLLPLRLPDDGAGAPRRPGQPRREYGLAPQQP